MVDKAAVSAFDLDSDIDDLPDLAEFKMFPTGAYRATFTEWEEKVIGDHPAISHTWQLEEIVELKEKLGQHPITGLTEEPPKPGDIMSIAYMTDNNTGLGFLKKDGLQPMAAKFGSGKKRDLMNVAKGKQALIVVAREWNEEKKRYYGKIVNTAYL